jgi:hypothetical protein
LNVPDDYLIVRATDAFNLKDYFACGKIILGRSLYKEFDILEIITKLGEKGKKNRTLAISMLKNVPQYLNYVI